MMFGDSLGQGVQSRGSASRQHRKKTAVERRQQSIRAERRMVQHLLKAFMSIEYRRGNKLSAVGRASQGVLTVCPTSAPAPRGAVRRRWQPVAVKRSVSVQVWVSKLYRWLSWREDHHKGAISYTFG